MSAAPSTPPTPRRLSSPRATTTYAGSKARPPEPVSRDGRHWLDRTVREAFFAETAAAFDRAIPEAIRGEPDARTFVSWLLDLKTSKRRAIVEDPTYADAGSLLDDWPRLVEDGHGVVAMLQWLRFETGERDHEPVGPKPPGPRSPRMPRYCG